MNLPELIKSLPHRVRHVGIYLRALGKPIRVNFGDFSPFIYPGTAETCAYLCHPFEPFTSELIERSMPPGGTFLDIGSQFGYFSLLAAKRAGPREKIYAFEPVPQNFELL